MTLGKRLGIVDTVAVHDPWGCWVHGRVWYVLGIWLSPSHGGARNMDESWEY